MTEDEIVGACRAAAAELHSFGYSPERIPKASTTKERLRHAHWMCLQVIERWSKELRPSEADVGVDAEIAQQIVEFDAVQRRAETMMWLGFIQGQLDALGLMTIDRSLARFA